MYATPLGHIIKILGLIALSDGRSVIHAGFLHEWSLERGTQLHNRSGLNLFSSYPERVDQRQLKIGAKVELDRYRGPFPVRGVHA